MRTLPLLFLLALLRTAAAFAEETPPVGPPWVRDFLAARRTALQEGKPIFLYHTKTH